MGLFSNSRRGSKDVKNANTAKQSTQAVISSAAARRQQISKLPKSEALVRKAAVAPLNIDFKCKKFGTKACEVMRQVKRQERGSESGAGRKPNTLCDSYVRPAKKTHIRRVAHAIVERGIEDADKNSDKNVKAEAKRRKEMRTKVWTRRILTGLAVTVAVIIAL